MKNLSTPNETLQAALKLWRERTGIALSDEVNCPTALLNFKSLVKLISATGFRISLSLIPSSLTKPQSLGKTFLELLFHKAP